MTEQYLLILMVHILDILSTSTFDLLLYTQVNAITAALFTTDVLEKNSARVAPEKNSNEKTITDETAVSIDEWSSGLEETDDSTLYFSPDLGNVVFSSAIDGWGFR